MYYRLRTFVVRLTGVEPVRPFGHKHLKLASLPIPAQPQSAVISRPPDYYTVRNGICQRGFADFILFPLGARYILIGYIEKTAAQLPRPTLGSLWLFIPRSGRVDPIKTCTDGRWVASTTLYCFQRPADLIGGREACKPRREVGVPF